MEKENDEMPGDCSVKNKIYPLYIYTYWNAYIKIKLNPPALYIYSSSFSLTRSLMQVNSFKEFRQGILPKIPTCKI